MGAPSTATRFSEGANLEARDGKGHWHIGNVYQARLRAGEPQYRICWSAPFSGVSDWLSTADGVRAVTSDQKRRRDNDRQVYGNVATRQVRAGAVCWTVEKLVSGPRRSSKGKGEEWRVRWAGFAGHKDEYTWEPTKNLPDELIADFRKEATQMKRAATVARNRPPPPPPHVRALLKAAPAVRQQRAADAEILQEELGRQAAILLRRQKHGSPHLRLLLNAPCSEAQFVGLFDRFRAMAVPLAGAHPPPPMPTPPRAAHHRARSLAGQPRRHVTDIVCKAGGLGGASVVDQFYVSNSDLIEQLVAPYNTGRAATGSLRRRSQNCLVMLVGPLVVQFTTVRGGDGPPPLHRVRVMGRFAALLSLAGKQPIFDLPVWAERRLAWKYQYKISIAVAARRLETQPGVKLLKFLNKGGGQLLK